VSVRSAHPSGQESIRARLALAAALALAGAGAYASPAPAPEPAAPAPASAAHEDEAVPARSTAAARPRSTGSVEGTVELGPRLKSRRMRFALYPQDAQQAEVAVRRTTGADQPDEFRNVVVYIEASEALGKVPGPPHAIPSMRQEGLAFVPHVLPVVRGAAVEFPNSDSVFHNVFSLSHAASFDLGRFPRGESRTLKFDESGVVKVFCHIHSDMGAVILVLDNPFFTAPDEQGRFRIDGLPAGEYRITAWHERARPCTRSIRVETGAAAHVAFSIPLSEGETGD
jgi:plastocyanin